MHPPARNVRHSSLTHPTRRPLGFTLIELLIVVVIIGILAAIAIPKFQNTKGKANFAAMRSDLHNLATAQEAYFYSNRSYTTHLDSLAFNTSHGVAVTINEGTGSGWSATATHPDSYPHMCVVFVGSAAPVDPATSDGVVACK
jgi:prepilin-type N-terminal cleavage/methylation domain-containing protein